MDGFVYGRTTDIDQIADLMARFIHEAVYTFTTDHNRAAQYLVEQGGAFIFAEHQGKTVGVLAFSLKDRPGINPGFKKRCGWIGCASVDENYRGTEVFRSMVRSALREMSFYHLDYVTCETEMSRKDNQRNYAQLAKMTGDEINTTKHICLHGFGHTLMTTVPFSKRGTLYGTAAMITLPSIEWLESYTIRISSLMKLLDTFYPAEYVPGRPEDVAARKNSELALN